MDLAWRRADLRSDLGKPGQGGVQGQCGGRRLPPADSRLLEGNMEILGLFIIFR